ncbi:hypothetical protein I5U67_07320 [Stenotrophomonas maltophilia]|uniref:Uncharacterized protein n=1 Tax=Stenotrophomonas maltophilia TaxID=40324 RepID=A0AA90AS70_STEMA|nr:hypothetical protein [Stenotrophomonas maltophilia]HDS1083295.1 hypothetical protein [Stenotrophomonas maltophilia]
MISSFVLKMQSLSDGGRVCVWRTTFKGKVFYTACGVGTPAMEHVSERTAVAKRALQDQADQAGMQHQHDVFVRTPYAAGISIHSTLTGAYHHEAVFFLCADPAVEQELIAFLNVVAS